MPHFITPTTEWPSMVFLSVYDISLLFQFLDLIMHCLKHAMRLWPVHLRNSMSVRPCTDRQSPDKSGHSVLPWAPSFPTICQIIYAKL